MTSSEHGLAPQDLRDYQAVWCEALAQKPNEIGCLVRGAHSHCPPGSRITLKIFSWFYCWWKSIVPWSQKGFTTVAITKYMTCYEIETALVISISKRERLAWRIITHCQIKHYRTALCFEHTFNSYVLRPRAIISTKLINSVPKRLSLQKHFICNVAICDFHLRTIEKHANHMISWFPAISSFLHGSVQPLFDFLKSL